MKKVPIIKELALVVLVLTILSCKKESIDKPSESIVGTFTGVFIRSSPTAYYAPSYVDLVFSSDSFSGKSSIDRYPAICRGKYKVSGKNIEFQNSCIWTADFDLTLILDGTYKMTKTDTSLSFSKTSNTNVFDDYRLKRNK